MQNSKSIDRHCDGEILLRSCDFEGSRRQDGEKDRERRLRDIQLRESWLTHNSDVGSNEIKWMLYVVSSGRYHSTSPILLNTYALLSLSLSLSSYLSLLPFFSLRRSKWHRATFRRRLTTRTSFARRHGMIFRGL